MTSAGGLLCLVTDRRRMSGPGRLTGLIDLVGRAARAGVDLIQIREPDLDDDTLTALVSQAVSRTASTRTRVIVNDRVDVALAAGAAGVHLRHDAYPAERVRSVCPPGWLVGRSVHGVVEAELAARSGAVDYLIMGTIFETESKPGARTVGLDGLAEVTYRVRIPVLAIGGVTVTRAASVTRSGAAGVAAIGEFIGAGVESGVGLDQVVSEFRVALQAGRGWSGQEGVGD